MIAAIRLGGEHGHESFTIVDLADLPLALSRKWTLGGSYVVTNPVGDESPSLHRQIRGLKRGDPRVIHHINENTLDNRRENLMVCTGKSDAQCQPHPRRDAACGMTGRGISWIDVLRDQVQRLVREAIA